MDKCGICDEIKDIKDIWNIPVFQNIGLIIFNDTSISKALLPNNNICEECANELLEIGRINGKNGFGYRLSLEYQRLRAKERNRILIFGGLNLLFAYYPIKKYFLHQGIIPKVVDLVESFCLMASETALRCGFKHGIMSPKEQLNIASLQNYDSISQQEKEEVMESLLSIQSFERIDKSFRRVMRKSGLLFDKRTSFIELMEKGHQYVSSNSFTETTLTVGRFLQSVEDDIYNGFINIVSFNCHPSRNAHTIIQHIINKVDVPYTHIESEGPWITANQEKLLETVAVQAKRLKKQDRSL